MHLFDCFDRAVVINLPGRRDRRRDMERQLELAGVPREHVEFFPAIRPSIPGDWPTLGAQGNFLSHYTLLRQARDSGVRSITILEDDCEFEPYLARVEGHLAAELMAADWNVVQLGHREPAPPETPAGLRASTLPLAVHWYAVHARALPALVEYLEAVMSRRAGHALGGPQFYDGALNMFRDQHPGIPIVVANPGLARQRHTRSDVTPRWFDRVPYVRDVVEGLRRLR